jgi:nucleoside-diphosphate-sugar epimerase
MKKIWVSGGSGFIGSHVVDECLARGYLVLAFDRVARPHKEGVKLFLGDIRDRNAVNESLSLTDGGIDLAGILGTAENVDNPFPAVETNIMGGLNFFDACRKHKKRGVQITVGNYWMNNTYSITKRTLEKFALMYNKEHGTQIALVRGLSVYGEGQKHKPIRKIAPNFICRALRGEKLMIYGSGETIQDQVYVKDIAYILVEALVNPNTRFDKVYEAGTGREVTVNQIAELVNKLTGNKAGVEHIPMRKGEDELSVIKANPETLKELGNHKFTTLEEGYEKVVKWYRENYNWKQD